MNFSEVNESYKSQMNDIFYNFLSYDGLFFEIESIHKLLLCYSGLFVTDDSANEQGKKAVEERERKVLLITLANKVIHYMETLGAIALDGGVATGGKLRACINGNEIIEKVLLT